MASATQNTPRLCDIIFFNTLYDNPASTYTPSAEKIATFVKNTILPPNFKSKLCERGNKCPVKSCKFAHNPTVLAVIQNLNARPSYYTVPALDTRTNQVHHYLLLEVSHNSGSNRPIPRPIGIYYPTQLEPPVTPQIVNPPIHIHAPVTIVNNYYSQPPAQPQPVQPPAPPPYQPPLVLETPEERQDREMDEMVRSLVGD